MSRSHSTLTRLLGMPLAHLQRKLLAAPFAGTEIKRLLNDARMSKQSCEVRFPRNGEIDILFVAAAIPLQLDTIFGPCRDLRQ